VRMRGTIATFAAAAGMALAWAPPALATIAPAPDSTWQTNGRVIAIAVSGNTVYLGGTFTEVEDHTGQTAVRNHVAAFDLSTGAVTSWAPNASGAVRAIVVSGSTVYLGGDFTTIDGKNRKRLGSVTTAGVVTSFKAQADASVFGVTMIGSTVYAGGSFTTINSTARTRLAAVNGTTGALVSGWTPAADGEVTSLAAASDGSKVFAGGLFSHIGSSSQNHVAALNPSTGATLSWSYHPSYPVEGMTATSSTLFLAGGGSGGRVGALSASSGAKLWEISVDGNVQGVAVTGSELVAGGHFDNVCDPGTNCQNPVVRHKVLAANVTTGALDTGWHPSVNSSLGVFGVAATSAKVMIGGDFTKAGGLDQAHYAQFSVT
jgi:hypothetical protein